MRALKVVDMFCGAGGTSTGLMQACARLDRRLDLVAVNHWETAIETHSANHPETEHLCENLDNIDPRKIFDGRLDILVASPECTHFSTARGGVPMSDQSRASAWHVVRWATELRPRWILVENVREFQTWGPLGVNGRPLKTKKGATFQAWVEALRSLNYTVEWRLLNSADFGGATSRRRLFVLARLGRHRRLPWPEPTHAAEEKMRLFDLKRWRAAREIIDWSVPSQSIFNRKRPLADATMRRIESGLQKFGGKNAEPFLVLLRNNQTTGSLDDPLTTISTSGAHHGLCEPFVIPQFSAAQPCSVENPLGTITTTSRGVGLCEPFLLPHRAFSKGHVDDVEDPLRGFTATNGGGGLVEPFLYTVTHGGRIRSLDKPMPTITCAPRGEHGIVEPFLVPYYGTGVPFRVEQPLKTITTKARFGLVEMPAYLDIRFRMLQPHELSAAMGFPTNYHFAGNKSERVRQIGNAVQVDQAEALCMAILEN